MPKIGIKLSNVDKTFNLEAKDYFLYPYYDAHTLPGDCQLTLKELSNENGRSLTYDYFFGQIFVRKYGLLMKFNSRI